MEKYSYTPEQRSTLEEMKIPFAIYQFLNQRVVTLILSDGFCSLFGYDDRARAYHDMDHDMYIDTHPDDVSRIANAAVRFATEGGGYDVIYRTRIRGTDDYKLVHALGEHVYTADGVRLAQVWYTDEGIYNEGAAQDDAGMSTLNSALNNALHEESFLKASRYDYLTGLPSMTYFFELAEQARSEALRRGGQLSVLFMNFTGMKFFNNRFSFAGGDRLLRAFARLLSQTYGSECCGRFGQDHFVVLTAEAQPEETLQRLFADCEKLNDGNSLPVHVGICRDWITDAHISKACDRAKEACDALQHSYGSAFGYYDAALRNDVKRRQLIQMNLDRAIEEKWIQVYYQPIIRAANGHACNEEALARWIDPEEGMLPPDSFIPYLEDSGQIYKLDLYVLEQVLEKLRIMRAGGHRVAPHSVNLSRADFDACDMVEEIRRRVDAAGIEREMIAIEITESIIGSDFDHMKEQVRRFQELGFPVWLDDFGSGYSSLDALQSIPFDLVKFDMSFMRKLGESDSSRIVLTELIKLVTDLGAVTLCEGVETQEQVRFLQEVGCSKLQGYYFEKPNPLEKIMAIYEAGPKYTYENPEEAPYYEALGSVNLYDLSVIGNEGETGLRNFFNTLPMGLLEVRGNVTRFVRSNQSYRDFVKRFLGFDLSHEGTDFLPYDDAFMNNIVKTCCEQGSKAFFDQQMPNGAVVHSFARRIGVNPVNGTVAVAVAVLSITDADEGATYASIARALASDYYNIYYLDLDTEHFIEYSSPVGGQGIAMERHGEQFFAAVRRDSVTRIHPDDIEAFRAAFSKEHILRELDEHGVFTITYRLIDTGAPVYVNMKVTRMYQGGNQIIIGISNIDAQMKQKAMLESVRKEQETLEKAMALSEDYISVYTVDPETGHYLEFRASSEYQTLGLATEGEDFFRHGIENGKKTVCPEDLPTYLQRFSKENILRQVREKGAFHMEHRLMMGGAPVPVSLRIAMVKEHDGEKLIAGVRIRDEARSAERSRDEEFQSLVDQHVKPCAVLSVEKESDGKAGMIRIVRSNRAYKEAMGSKYYDNMPYYELVPRVLRFENSCYRCAIEHQLIHNYTQTKVDSHWTDQQLIPLNSDREDMGYCQFVLELSETRNRERMAAVSARTAAAVLRATITLLGTNDLKERVGTVLSDILEVSEAFQVRVMLIDHENRHAINYCDRMAIELPEDYVPPEEDPDAALISYKLICSWEQCLTDGNSLIVTNEEEMDELEKLNPSWVRTMRAYGVTTLLLIPLRHEHEITGYLYLCNFNPDKITEVRELAELMSFFLGTEIYNEVLLERLDEMSHTDALTGLNNRNAMIRRTKQIAQSGAHPAFGVVNIDLNGLKNVNDIQGHDAGDQLLVTAAEMLKKFFYVDDLYRTGGDEFIVIATGITKEAFDRKVERLRLATEKENAVSFAIGAVWSDGSTDIHTAFRQADEFMYADKNAYYDAHPELKR